MKVVAEKLKDPSSAQWQWYAFKGETTYCGRVNAKNSYGGYTGFSPFYVIFNAKDGPNKPIAVMLSSADPDDPISRTVSRLCLDDGYPITDAPD